MSSVPIQRKETPVGSLENSDLQNVVCARFTTGAATPAPVGKKWWQQQEERERIRKQELELLAAVKRERDPYTQTVVPGGRGQKWFSLRTANVYFKSPSKDNPQEISKERMKQIERMALLRANEAFLKREAK